MRPCFVPIVRRQRERQHQRGVRVVIADPRVDRHLGVVLERRVDERDHDPQSDRQHLRSAAIDIKGVLALGRARCGVVEMEEVAEIDHDAASSSRPAVHEVSHGADHEPLDRR